MRAVYRYLQAKGITYWIKWSFITLVCVEIIHRVSLVSWVGWIVRKPVPALLNYIIILAVFLVFNAILGQRRSATVLGFITIILLAIVDHLKLYFLHQHLYPVDFLSIPELLTLLPSQSGGIFWVSILVLSLIPLLGYFLFKVYRQKQTHLFSRAIMLIASLYCLAVITTVVPIDRFKTYFDEVNVEYDHNRNYKSNGLLFAIALNVKPLLQIESPVKYSKTQIQQIMQTLPHQSIAPTIKPNVIMVMNEALFDVTQLSVDFSNNPLTHLKSLQDIHGESSLVVPTYGSATSNTEFEVLTGLSMSFLPQGSVPYQQHIRQKIPSLPHIFKENGYATLAIHPYQQYFFNREIVYPLLGFDDYISLEDWDNPQYVGKYVSDADVTQKIIQFADDFTQPYFIFAITMQNHMPFTTPQNEDFKVIGDSLSADSQEKLSGYLAGVSDADDSLHALITHFEKSPHPTIIVFFGDHLPALKAIYTETQFFEKNAQASTMYTVPALLWSNYKKIPPVQAMSTSYLGGYVLEQAGISPPAQFALLQHLRKDNELINHAAHFQNYQLLQYDMLFGEQYFLTP